MRPLTIHLPERVFEEQLSGLLAALGAGDPHEAVEIDISRVKFLTPAAIVSVLARCHWWSRNGKVISLGGVAACEVLGYLQRVDFLRHLGIELEERFTRRATTDRFVPVRSLNFSGGSVEEVASEITRCVLPDTHPEDDVYRALQYAAGELLSNAKYHSGGRAFASAQFFPARNLVRIAVADDGMGIRRSFINTSREEDAATADTAIRLALTPGVSSALLRPISQPYGGQNHRGVGLSITRILAKEARGRLTIATEDGWFDEFNGREISQTGAPHQVPGTLVALSLHRDQIADYAAMHAAAMAEIGMTDLDTQGIFLD